MRTLLRRLHLWMALVFGALFVLSGLTGTALAWMHELDAALNPRLFNATAAAVTPARAQAVIERLAADPAYGRASQLMLPQREGESYVAWYRTAGALARQVMVDGATLQVLGERNWGEFGLSRPLLMPTLFHLHRYLLAGEAGKTVVGVSGLLLVMTSLTGLVLGWPGRRRAAWKSALRISCGGSWRRLAATAHRAVGFFALPLLALLGFSGLYFNLPNWVVPAVSVVAPMAPNAKPANRTSGAEPIAPERALQAAQQLYPQGRLSRIALPTSESMPYEVRLRQPGELRQGDGATRVSIDAYSGAVLRAADPLRAAAGDRFLGWLFPLHTGEALGLPGRVLICATGLLPLLFLISGLTMWRRSIAASRNRKSPSSGRPGSATGATGRCPGASWG